jgi:hypothetical protein
VIRRVLACSGPGGGRLAWFAVAAVRAYDSRRSLDMSAFVARPQTAAGQQRAPGVRPRGATASREGPPSCCRDWDIECSNATSTTGTRCGSRRCATSTGSGTTSTRWPTRNDSSRNSVPGLPRIQAPEASRGAGGGRPAHPSRRPSTGPSRPPTCCHTDGPPTPHARPTRQRIEASPSITQGSGLQTTSQPSPPRRAQRQRQAPRASAPCHAEHQPTRSL